ncbi:MAG: RNAse P Rpr2/Rpp21/SNM1 subunit domain-containing protein [Benjaminiella poitrasii]|nr:MAG: RNAse P Rpr2/Rpp21/SNM1 subunit domain-containing protein [Benjaminiella poitrasii]
MSNQPQTHQQTQRLDFLFTASHAMFSACPSLSRYYMNEFQNTLTEYELTASKPIARLSCSSCGQILIPGLTSKTEITIKGKRRSNRQQKNRVRSTCLTCQRSKLYHGSFKQKIPKNESLRTNTINTVPTTATATKVVKTVHKTTVTKATVTKTTNVTANKNAAAAAPASTEINKKKKNKGKKNNLKALLLKQQQNQNSSSGGGGLGDFLSSL